MTVMTVLTRQIDGAGPEPWFIVQNKSQKRRGHCVKTRHKDHKPVCTSLGNKQEYLAIRDDIGTRILFQWKKNKLNNETLSSFRGSYLNTSKSS